MNYLFLGSDGPAKDQKIGEIKKKVFKVNTFEFDYEVLHAHKLDSSDLKKALLALPAIAEKRLVVLRQIDKLNPHNKELILEFLRQDTAHVDLIFESDESETSTVFLKELAKSAQVVHFKKEIPSNVFDMTNAISARKPAEALTILGNLLTDDIHPLQIMGGVVWFWGKSKNRVSVENFEKGLRVLQDADLNIKRSRVKPEHALEMAVVKLSSLIGG